MKDKVKHAGEIIAVVVAESRYIAEDAVEEVNVSYEPLPAVTDLEKCLDPGHTLVHDDLDTNLAPIGCKIKGIMRQLKKMRTWC